MVAFIGLLGLYAAVFSQYWQSDCIVPKVNKLFNRCRWNMHGERL